MKRTIFLFVAFLGGFFSLAEAQWNQSGSDVWVTNSYVGIGTPSPLGLFHVSGFGGDKWIYFNNNINGEGNPENISGLSFGWNRSGAKGESVIVYNKSVGSDPRLDFSSFDGATYQVEMTIRNGLLGIGTISPKARFHSHEPSVLGAASGSFQLLSTVSGQATNFFAHNEWLLRDGVSSQQWWTARLHDGISVDESYFTPGQDTRTWWERDPHDNIQSWGDRNETYMTLRNGALGLGTTAPDAMLTVKGNIHTREVNVDLAGAIAPDYVFEGDYPLLSLSDIEQFILDNKHLPETPSAKDMEASGLNLKEMSLLLLKKVEELTLHLIEQEKVNRLQAEEIDTLRKMIER